MILREEHQIRRWVGRAKEDLVDGRRRLDLGRKLRNAVPRIGLLGDLEAELFEVRLHQQADFLFELGSGDITERDRVSPPAYFDWAISAFAASRSYFGAECHRHENRQSRMAAASSNRRRAG